MDVLVVIALFALVLLLPPLVLTRVLRRTPVFWLPGSALIVLGVVAFVTAPPIAAETEGSLFPNLGRDISLFFGWYGVIYGVVLLIWGINGHHTAIDEQALDEPPEPPVELPRAQVIRR